MSFVHLHVHSQYSLSSSLVSLEPLVDEVARMEMNALALTDWANLYGALHFYKQCKASDGKVKPIFGVEMGVTIEGSGPYPRHLVLLAENFTGWKNLCRIVTESHTRYGLDGEVLRPHIPLAEILKNKDGLIALTAGLKGVLNSFLIQDQEKHALETLKTLKESFGEKNLFLELQDSSMSPQKYCNEKLIEWGRKEGLGVVATADVHYMKQEDAFAQEVWMMVAQKLNLEQNPSSRLSPREYYLRSPEEMKEAFHFVPEALSNTVAIADRCNVKLSFKDDKGKRIYHLPTFSKVVAAEEGKIVESEGDIFARLSKEGLDNRLTKIKAKLEKDSISRKAAPMTAEQEKVYWDRLAYEVDTIKKMGFAGYYLIVSDFIRWAKSHDIPVGPGRGSGAGSLAAYCLDITDLDPIEDGLLFERFLNPERVSLPDFDVDFCQERRGEVIKYVAEKYGKDHVCQIVTFAKEQSKNALKDVGRVLGLSFGETNRITKLIPSVMAKPLTLQETLEQVDEFKDLVKNDPKIRQTTELALKIEGALRQPGVHAAGVIIASKPVNELAPLSMDTGGNLITQWDMKYSEEAGLVKFDFLGLVTLDLMHLACKLINQRSEPEAQQLRYDNIPVDDPRSYAMISKGLTMGVFQLESSGMQNLCVRMKPDRFGDITAINALFRPGPLQSGMVDDFINRKHGRAKVEVMFPEMEPSLRETYGVIVYQEQVMEIARVIGGYSLGGADLLRRAMGKKDPAEMERQRVTFVDGAVKQGRPAAKSGELFDLIEKFAGYGFNKSHAAAYALLAVQTAYLKAVYPTEFFAALLTIEKQDTEKLSRYIADAKVMGLEILPPDVNQSELDFSIVRPTADNPSAKTNIVRFGLSAVKNVGESAVESILEARKSGGPFKDLFDFTARVDTRRINKRVVEALIQAGAFDSCDPNDVARLRGRYLASAEKALEWASKVALQKELGQFSLFGGDGGSSGTHGAGDAKDSTTPGYEIPLEIPSQKQLLDWEKELLGIYLSGTPLDRYLERAKNAGCTNIFDLREKNPKSQVTVCAWVSAIREVRVKKGRRAGELMAILMLEDVTGQIEYVSFPDHFKENGEILKSGQPLLIRAELDFEDDKPKLIGSSGGGGRSYPGKQEQQSKPSGPAVEDLSLIEEKWPKKLRVSVQLSRLEGTISAENLFNQIAELLVKYQGSVPVELLLSRSGEFSTSLDLAKKFSVRPNPTLLQELASMVAIPGGLRVDTLH